MNHTKPVLAAKMKIRAVYEYSDSPAYEVLLFQQGYKCWRALTKPDGSRALFSVPPLTEQEARDVIRQESDIKISV